MPHGLAYMNPCSNSCTVHVAAKNEMYAIGCVLVPVGGRASVLVAVLVFKF
jgi:hypothetical protein